MPRYRVYVIELDRAVMQIRTFRERNPDARADKPCVYVGSTWLEPQKRFEQHKAGVKANRFARKFGVKLRERLMKHLQSYETRALAMAAEKRCAEGLRRRWYGVCDWESLSFDRPYDAASSYLRNWRRKGV